MTVSTIVVALLANQIGGIAPDIDQPTAPFWRNLPIGGVVGRAFTRLLGGHRFLTHSLLGLLLMGLGVKLLLHYLAPLLHTVDPGPVWWAFMIGAASHLVMDSFTQEGVPWLLPIPVKFGFPPVRAWRITTGKFAEAMVIFPGLAAFNIWYISGHYREFLELVRSRII